MNADKHGYRSLTGDLEFFDVSEENFDDLVAIRIAAMRESLERVGRFDPDRARERLRQTFVPEHTRMIYMNKERVGFYTFRPDEDGYSLDHLYVLPSFQGRGIGAEVLRNIFVEADRNSLPIKVGALKESASNRFYQRHGFVKAGESEWDIYYIRVSQYDDRALMRKIPSSLRTKLQAYDWFPIAIGKSRATVCRLSCPDKDTLILKSQRREALFDLRGEAERLRWLQGRLPVPAVVDYVEDATHDHLLMRALPGEDAATVKLDPGRLVAVLAEALRELHAIDIAHCPFVHTADKLIERAEAVMAAGEVDESNFDLDNLGRKPEVIFAEMLASKPKVEDLVFTHGDFCLPNLMVYDGRLSGFIDVGAAGIGDRYRDLALIGRSITSNLGAKWVEVFLEHYGLKEPDRGKLRYYRLLDEFF